MKLHNCAIQCNANDCNKFYIFSLCIVDENPTFCCLYLSWSRWVQWWKYTHTIEKKRKKRIMFCRTETEGVRLKNIIWLIPISPLWQQQRVIPASIAPTKLDTPLHPSLIIFHVAVVTWFWYYITSLCEKYRYSDPCLKQ